jgi:spore maturation protein CgeB
MFLAPGTEVLVARDGADVVDILSKLSAAQAAAIGRAARGRILDEHTYDRRGAQVHRVLTDALGARREALAA